MFNAETVSDLSRRLSY